MQQLPNEKGPPVARAALSAPKSFDMLGGCRLEHIANARLQQGDE